MKVTKVVLGLCSCFAILSSCSREKDFSTSPIAPAPLEKSLLQTVDPGWNPAADIYGAVRYRNFNNSTGGEIYLGQAGTGRVEVDFDGGYTCKGTTPVGSWQSSNSIVFTYNPTTGRIRTEVSSSHDYCLEYTIGNKGAINFMYLIVANRAEGTTVNLENVSLNGDFQGDFIGRGWSDWIITDVDLTNGFTLEGDIVLAGEQPNSEEQNKVEIQFGYLAPPNELPDCSGARASVEILWPVTHGLVPIEIFGITDPDGDPISVTVTSIFQDEPVNGTGDGAFAPDGFGVGTSSAQVRAERDGAGNGRVYHIAFKADDGQGGTCLGEVQVAVPKSADSAQNVIDDGALYDSTLY